MILLTLSAALVILILLRLLRLETALVLLPLPACGHATCSGSCPSITTPADLSMCPSCGGDASTPSFTINPSDESGAVPKCEFCCPSCRAPLEVPSAFEELLFIQRLGFQDTLDLAATCKAVDGLPHFTSAGVHYTVLDGESSTCSSY